MPDFNVIKRNGTVVPFDPSRIENAIKKAIIASHENMTYDQIDNNILIDLVYEVYKDCQNWIDPLPETTGIGVEKIQDFVERELIKAGFADTAKEYILYRQKRNEIRNSRDSISSAISELLGKDSSESDLKRDNGNVNGDGAMGTMLQIGSNVSKAYYLENDINKTAADNHRSGRIHIHDLDFYKLTVTCCQIDCLKLFKNGFDTGHGYIREPNPISTYAALAAIAIQSDQNDCHGGQSIPNFDYSMAPGVLKSFRRSLKENIDRINTLGLEISETEKNELSAFYDDTYTDKDLDNILNQAVLHHGEEKNVTDKIVTMAYKEVNKQTYQAMEGFVHNLNSMHSRAGAQVPFSSINFGTDISTAGRMVIENLLLAIEAGLGHGETAIFPIAIFKVKEGVNYYPEDPNYDLFKLACRVSAKRLFPNFAFLDAPFNKQYYKEGVPESEVTYMGCVQGDETITYKFNGYLFVESFKRFWERMIKCNVIRLFGESQYIITSGIVQIYDTSSGKFVDCKKLIKNPNKNNWVRIKFNNGRSLLCTLDHPLPVMDEFGQFNRTFVSDMKIGDKVPVTYNQYSESTIMYDKDIAWLLGVLLCDSNYSGTITISLGIDEMDIIEKVKYVVETKLGGNVALTDMREKTNENYYQVRINLGEKLKSFKTYLFSIFGGNKKSERHIPNEVFSWDTAAKYSFLAGMIDADGYCSEGACGSTRIMLGSTNKELALQQMALVQALGYPCKMYLCHYTTSDPSKLRYRIEFATSETLYSFMSSNKKIKRTNNINYPSVPIIDTVCSVISIEPVYVNEDSYDVETESDRFDVSGIISHNCRSRVMGNVHDPSREQSHSRGNLSFTSINLPMIALESEGDEKKFYQNLHKALDVVKAQLLERFEIQAKRKVYNFPFLMGQGIWLDSEKLKWDDEVREVIKHGSLAIGFVGLAETLVALYGHHHGEGEEYWKKGYNIIKYMREYTDKAAEETKLNFAVIASPAESFAGRALRKTRDKFGVIEGITDREYFTNSNHIPVYYPISAYDKIRLEAPFHELTNGGHITYVELDGDTTKNIDVFEKIIRCMHDAGIGYGSINHPVDRDPVCGYTGVINDECPNCKRKETEDSKFERIRRITGYLVGTLTRWNSAKKAEEEDRVKHEV